MTKDKFIGWDLGGAEGPYDPDYQVVDNSIEYLSGTHYDDDETPLDPTSVIVTDLRKDFTKVLEPRQRIRVGQVIRYLQHEDGYTISEPIDPEIFRTFGRRLYHIMSDNCTVTLFDHIGLLELVVDGMFQEANADELNIEQCEIVNFPDEDLPGDWEWIIKN